MRYFVRFYYQNSMPEAVLLFRLDIDNLAETLTEEQWDDTNGIWIPTDMIMPVLILGNTDIDEVDAISAQKFFPQAFQERTIPMLRTTPISQHCAIFVGSSLLGVMTGDDNFLQVFGFLQKKSNEGKLQCFHWRCKECKTTPLKKGATPINHLVKISFPNVLKLIGDYKVQWKWEEPESEWAKSQGSPIEQFKELVTKNSRPNWKVLVR